MACSDPAKAIEYALRDRLGYAWALAFFQISTILILALGVSLGSERRARNFVAAAGGTPLTGTVGGTPR